MVKEMALLREFLRAGVDEKLTNWWQIGTILLGTYELTSCVYSPSNFY